MADFGENRKFYGAFSWRFVDVCNKTMEFSKQKFEDFAEAGGPGVFVVLGAGDPEVAEILTRGPAATR